MNIVQGYPFSSKDNPDALFSSYNVIYYGICEDPKTGQYSYQSAGYNGECYLAGNYIPSLNRITLLGQKSDNLSSAEYGDVYWAAVEAVLCMGSYSSQQYWTPVQVIRKGIDLTLHHHGPYTMTRKTNTAEAPAKAPVVSKSKKSYKLTIR